MVLVTGATGLVGSYLVKLLLAKGQQVRAIKRTTSNLALLGQYADKVEWVIADILDVTALNDAMQGVSKVYHCAAVISFLPAEVDYMMKANIEGTANVMNAAIAAGVQKVVHVSSIAALGIAPEGKVIDENYADPNINKSFWYFKSKHYAEREAWRANAEGLDVVVACPSTIIGAGFWGDEPNSLFPEIYKGLKFYTTSTMGFVDVRDVAESLYLLMESDYTEERFIISSQNLSFRDVMWQMADALKVNRPSIQATGFLRSIAWRLEKIKVLLTGKHPIVTKESANIASVNFAYSNQKFVAAFNYHFRPVSQTITDTANAYLQSVQRGENWGVYP